MVSVGLQTCRRVPASLVIRDLRYRRLVTGPSFAGGPPETIAAIGQETLQQKCHLSVSHNKNTGALQWFRGLLWKMDKHGPMYNWFLAIWWKLWFPFISKSSKKWMFFLMQMQWYLYNLIYLCILYKLIGWQGPQPEMGCKRVSPSNPHLPLYISMDRFKGTSAGNH